MTNPIWIWLPAIIALGAGTVASAVDLRCRRIPNLVTLPSLAACLIACLLTGLAGSGQGLGVVGRGLAGTVVWAGLLLPVAWWGALGMGDVKLAAVLGAGLGSLGWGQLGTGIVVSMVAAGLYALVVAARSGGRSATIPYGPWLTCGAVVACGLHAGGVFGVVGGGP